MLNRFCIACVGLSMMCFLASTTLKAMDDLSNIEGKSKAYLSLPPSYEKLILKVGDPSRRRTFNLDLFIDYKFAEMHKRQPTIDEERALLKSCFKAVEGLNGLFIVRTKKHFKREPAPEEIEANLERIDEYLRERICKGDFNLDITEDLEREGYYIKSA